MKVALLSLLFRRYHLDKIFEVAAEAGYDGVEIWGGRPQAYPYDMDEARCEQVLELKQKYHLEVPMYTPEVLGYPFNIATTDEKERVETIDYLKKALDVAKAIEACINEYYPGTEVHIEHAEGLDECRKMLMLAKAGKKNGCLIEGMGCPGGCVAGAGTNIPINKAMVEVRNFAGSTKKAIPDPDVVKDYHPE